MSNNSEVALVAQITVKTADNTIIFYVTNREGIVLDSINYDDVVTVFGDADSLSPLGEDTRTGSMTMTLINGERYLDGGYYFDNTAAWNNQSAVIKRWEAGMTTWVGCEPYHSGLTKDFKINLGHISLSVDMINHNDSILFPQILVQDNSEQQTTKLNLAGNSGAEALGLIVDNPGSLFTVGEMVLVQDDLNRELVRIKSFDEASITIEERLVNAYSIERNGFVSKCFLTVPQDSINKSVPIQIGDLTNKSDGVFAKGLTVSNKIGEQEIIFDSIRPTEFLLNNNSGIGCWESGNKRFFVGKSEGEYSKNSSGLGIEFVVDSTTALADFAGGGEIVEATEGITPIEVADYTKLVWDNEVSQTKWSTLPELLGVNIIAIDNELMMLIDKPTSSTVYVERGFNGTPITTHAAGAKIYQAARYAAKNLLSFTERFDAKGITNQYLKNMTNLGGIIANTTMSTFIKIGLDGGGKLSNVINQDISKYLEFYNVYSVTNSDQSTSLSFLNMDIKFEKIEDDFTLINLFTAVKASCKITESNPGGTSGLIYMGFHDPNSNSSYDVGLQTDVNNPIYQVGFFVKGSNSTSPTIFEIDGFTSLNRNDGYSLDNNIHQNINLMLDPFRFSLTTLKDLNKKWKFQLMSGCRNLSDTSNTATIETKIYAIGFWADFFIDFTKRAIMGTLKGRSITQDIVDVCGLNANKLGTLATNPVDVLALLLIQEGRYSPSVFDTGSWVPASAFRSLPPSSNDGLPTAEVAFSYGLDDERMPIWDFCQKLANHYNLALVKSDDGSIGIVDIWKKQQIFSEGLAIPIDTVLFVDDSRRMTIEQTGVDQIYNDVVVKWKRNNSTGEYQEVFTLDQNHFLAYAGTGINNVETLLVARNRYYGGQKKTLTIESPFIYNESDAKRKAIWEVNDKAQPHFFATLILDYDHYSNVNGVLKQYAIGSIVYLVGKHAGIEFQQSNKWIVKNVIKRDQGREIELQIKSIQSCFFFKSLYKPMSGSQRLQDTFIETFARYQNTFSTQAQRGDSQPDWQNDFSIN